MARFNKSFCMLKSRLSTTIIRQQKWPEVNPGEQHQDVKRQYFFDLIHVYELNIRIKVAPRVEKTEVFKNRWNFANQTYFTIWKMKKYYFLLWVKEAAFFSPYFYQWNYFLQHWAICLCSQLWILLEHLYVFKRNTN